MDKLFYDRKSKKLYVKELISEKSGDILVVHNEAYIDVTDEILGLLESKRRVVKEPIPTMPIYPANWGCDGTHCTNPQMDCINCPRKNMGGSFSTSSASGTSAATLHGNTSVTDGKPHNPSFTD